MRKAVAEKTASAWRLWSDAGQTLGDDTVTAAKLFLQTPKDICEEAASLEAYGSSQVFLSSGKIGRDKYARWAKDPKKLAAASTYFREHLKEFDGCAGASSARMLK